MSTICKCILFQNCDELLYCLITLHQFIVLCLIWRIEYLVVMYHEEFFTYASMCHYCCCFQCYIYPWQMHIIYIQCIISSMGREKEEDERFMTAFCHGTDVSLDCHTMFGHNHLTTKLSASLYITYHNWQINVAQACRSSSSKWVLEKFPGNVQVARVMLTTLPTNCRSVYTNIVASAISPSNIIN